MFCIVCNNYMPSTQFQSIQLVILPHISPLQNYLEFVLMELLLFYYCKWIQFVSIDFIFYQLRKVSLLNSHINRAVWKRRNLFYFSWIKLEMFKNVMCLIKMNASLSAYNPFYFPRTEITCLQAKIQNDTFYFMRLSLVQIKSKTALDNFGLAQSNACIALLSLIGSDF